MSAKWLPYVYIVVALGASTVPTMSSVASDIVDTSPRFLQLDRATAYTLMVEVPCRPNCGSTVSLEHKTSGSTWTNPEKVSVHTSFNDTFILEQLQPDTVYFIRARLSAAGEYTRVLATPTCAAKPPPVTSLRVVDSGAGWLDIRWTPPTEICDSRFWYSVRYKAQGKEFTASKKYGMYTHNVRFIRFRPTHPCPTWPSEFCLLLTDNVEPGKNHTIEVQVVRVVSTHTDEISVPAITYGVANTMNFGSFNISLCQRSTEATTQDLCPGGGATRDAEPVDGASCTAQEHTVLLWTTVAGWATAAFLLIMIIVMLVVARTGKTHGNECNNDHPSPMGNKEFPSLEMVPELPARNVYAKRNK